jgi:hypothetical protein
VNFQVVQEVRVDSENLGFRSFTISFYFVSIGVPGLLVAFVVIDGDFIHAVVGTFEEF